jgi:hypothetical protein
MWSNRNSFVASGNTKLHNYFLGAVWQFITKSCIVLYDLALVLLSELKACNVHKNLDPKKGTGNPSYSGGRDQEDLGWKPAPGK